MNNKGNYIKVRYNVNINDDQIYVVTNNKAVLLTKDNAKKMSRILNKYRGRKINNFTYIYEDYDKIMNDFFNNKRTKKVNRNKSKRIALGIISGSLVTLLLSGVYTQIKNKETNEIINEAIVFEDDSIEVPVMQDPYIDVDVAISNIEGDNNSFNVDVSIDSNEDKVEDTKTVDDV